MAKKQQVGSSDLDRITRELDIAKQTSGGDLFGELGSTGLKRIGARGLVDEEFLKDLTGERSYRVYREMRDNDPVVGAILFAMEMLVRTVTWSVEGPDEDTNEFIESCMEDMSQSWSDFISEVLSMLTYGYSWHEIIYKKRSGSTLGDPGKSSNYSDGKIGWRKLPIRSQDTLQEWGWDEEGGIQEFIQSAPPYYHEVRIPISRSLLFRVGVHKGNPEGRSILRNAYRPWWFKRRIEEIEAIGIERDLAGLPVIYRDATVAAQYDTELKKIVRNVRRDEQDGILLPLAYDENGNKLLEFTLMASAGKRQIDVSKTIDRYEKNIANTVLADFILLGQNAVGSYALASSKTELFAVALGAIIDAIASVLNRYAIPRLMSINTIPVEKWPKFTHSDLETPDLKEVGAYVTSLAGAGAALFPDDELENHLRKIGNLPQKQPGQGEQVAVPKVPGKGKGPAAPKAEAPVKAKGVDEKTNVEDVQAQ